MVKSILFLSNGYAEDAISASIIEKLHENLPDLEIKALPLVGEGKFYNRTNTKVLGPCRVTASGGFMKAGLSHIVKDIKSGYLKALREYVTTLKTERISTYLVVCVGDIFLVLLSVLFVKRPIIFLPTAKSDYIRQHYKIEKWLMRHFCQLVITRDKKTASSLRSSGIPAVYVGNAMMDCLKITGEDFGIRTNEPVIGILPGSKQEAYDNLMTILDATEEITKQMSISGRVNFLLALAPSLELRKIADTASKKDGWTLKDSTLEERKKGVIAHLVSQDGTIIKVTQGRFGDVLNRSQVIIGLSGMGNEQAVGMGKPVVTFPGKGPQITKKFLQVQQKLLGGATFIVKNNGKAVADKVCSLLHRPEELNRIVRIGRERMGEAGASKRIAKMICERLIKNGKT